MDRPNQLDDLWEDWEKKTLEQKQTQLKKAVARMPKVLFSSQDHDNLFDKALEVGKALNLKSSQGAIITPSKKWIQEHDPNYYRRKLALAKLKPGERLPPDLDGWVRDPK